MSARKEGTDADRSSGVSLFDLLSLDDEDNCSDELNVETPPASAQRKLASFLSESGNELCADCGAPDPKWVSVNLGACVCIKCSGAHRSLGVHISKILSVNLDEWTEEDVDNLIKLGGNTAVNLKYEDSIPNSCRKPQPDSSIEDRTDFIKRKYVMQQFLNTDEQLSCPFTPEVIHCSSTGLNSVVEKKYLNSMRLHNFGQAFLNTRKRKDAEQKSAKKSSSTAGMVEFVGMIKVNVVSGTNLAVRDMRSSDPYVMLSLGNQSMKTRVIKSNLNPVWNEKLMLSIPSDVPPLIVLFKLCRMFLTRISFQLMILWVGLRLISDPWFLLPKLWTTVMPTGQQNKSKRWKREKTKIPSSIMKRSWCRKGRQSKPLL
ncbi:putative ADP-ribosylation factor GTPase-activating protein AGD11 isoform X2 [Bidens hawaiensis]|uniref:putative ADP-ribosylation factor GTPase-activating protein AGD11 isoform X2 n=1 Tax=Bidens hawaiensis TaxID=980011 RepID=UPI00404A66E8